MEHELAVHIFLIIGFLVVAVGSSVLLKKLHFPYTIGLVVIGIIFGYLAKEFNYTLLTDLNLTPETILYLILPTLIYDAAIKMDLRALRKNIVPILLLAVIGLLISAGIIGSILSFTVMSIGAALLFGALISATDPVAVIALFNEIGAPRRLVTLVDGESIFNDATAIVLFTIVLSSIHSGVTTVGGLFFLSFARFMLVLLGGLAVGAIVGAVGGFIVRLQKNNVLLQITVSLIMAYISFIAADQLHVSGVMSTLAAGIVVSLLSNNVLKHENQHFLENFWDYFSFVANSFVFLLLGLTEANSFSNPQTVVTSLLLLLIVIPAVTAARAAVIYLLIPLYNRFVKDHKIPAAFQTILFWGGLRGAVPVALVLAIPHDFPGRDIIVHITFGYILFTLLVQGTTVKGLMGLFKIRPEKSYFDYHKGISYSLDVPTAKLLELVTGQVLTQFKDEGFFVSEPESEGSGPYLLRRGQKYLSVEAEKTQLTITAADQVDLAYGKQTIYETLLELDNSVISLGELVKSPEIKKIVEEENGTGLKPTLNLKKFIKTNLICLSLQGKDKKSIIEELVEFAADRGAIFNKEMALQEVLERESTMSTGLDNGVAIPHAKCDASENIILVVGIKKDGVDFDSLDKQPTKFFFLIISPKSQAGPHIQLLAEIGMRMNHAEIRERLLTAKSPAEVMAVLTQK